MATVFDTVGAWFNGDIAGLCPKYFDELYWASPPESHRFPFCVMTPNQKSKLERSNKTEYHEEHYRFNIVTRTEEEGSELADLVADAFQDKEREMTAMGLLPIIRLDYINTTGPEQQALDLYLTVIEFKCMYAKARP